MEAVGMNHHARLPSRRKRRAEAQPEGNERLSKRLSLLNLEQSGTKLYVPVESTQAQSTNSPPAADPSSFSTPPPPGVENDTMQLDDSKHKVYIYNLDDELSSESEPEDGKLVFLPDIEKHLRKNRIPAQVLAGPDTDFVGKELVLYRIPASLSVPEEKDSVRKAIIEARARVREQQEVERRAFSKATAPSTIGDSLGQAFATQSTASEASSAPTGYAQGPFAQAVPASGAGSDPDEMDLD
ncbi:hypothetical protein GQ53DRAFT_816402 [Thozetella sp. PMI_491]|nr:hypothetical protein GQ53DRAFT_816402 [Thozetella sp. PMI_491]